MNDTTRTAKNLLLINTISWNKIDPGTPQQASEMQYPMFMVEFTRKLNGANSVCDVITFLGYINKNLIITTKRRERSFIWMNVVVLNFEANQPNRHDLVSPNRHDLSQQTKRKFETKRKDVHVYKFEVIMLFKGVKWT